MLRTLAGCVVLITVAVSAPRVSPDPMLEPGVSFALADDRARRVTELGYDLRFSIPESLSEPVTGEASISFHLSDTTRPLVLDFLPAAGGVTRASIPLESAPEHLVIAPDHLREGANRVTIEFTASEAALNRNDGFMYTLFVPARARLTFPCFDQPDLKARYTLSLEIPAEWEAVTNGAEIARTDQGARRLLRFAPTEPIPTYLFAFAAGRFEIERAERNGRQFRMLHRETDATKVARNRNAIFDLHAAALAWLERYTTIPYPFPKFDFVLIPSFQFGGMEHPGAIFYNAPALFLDESATRNQELGRASLIAHETAHMWFGDLVTMRWFDDVWMKEVFANFMAAKIVNPSFPDINHDLRFLFSHYPAAYEVDRTPGTNAIRQRLDNLNEAGSLYGAIIYQKAPIVMRQLEMILGETELRDGLRDYLRNHAYANASWPDLIALLDARTPQDLAAWSRAWVEEAGRPDIDVELEVGRGESRRLRSSSATRRRRADSHGTSGWDRPRRPHGHGSALAATRCPARRTREREGPARTRLRAAYRWRHRVRWIPAAGFHPRLPAGAPARTLRSPHARKRDRHALGGNARKDGSGRSALFEMLLRSVETERDELNVQRMLGYIQDRLLALPFAGGPARPLGAALERVLRAGLDRAGSPSLKSAWFGALRDTATNPATTAWLTRVWDGDETVEGLVLAEPDFITLALELAVRGTEGLAALLDRQAGRIENPDRKARFAFVRPALSPHQAERDAFFASLADVGNRRREPWVLEALNYLHHPLRAAESEGTLRRALRCCRSCSARATSSSRSAGSTRRSRDTVAARRRSGTGARQRAAGGVPGQAPPDHPVVVRQADAGVGGR
jgi:aminopeptidase N